MSEPIYCRARGFRKGLDLAVRAAMEAHPDLDALEAAMREHEPEMWAHPSVQLAFQDLRERRKEKPCT